MHEHQKDPKSLDAMLVALRPEWHLPCPADADGTWPHCSCHGPFPSLPEEPECELFRVLTDREVKALAELVDDILHDPDLDESDRDILALRSAILRIRAQERRAS